MNSTEENRLTMRSVLADARDSLVEYLSGYAAEGDTCDISDAIHEVADGAVPVYYVDQIRLAADDPDLATREPELGPAFDGKPTPCNIIAANIYEAVTADLWEYWHDELEDRYGEVAK